MKFSPSFAPGAPILRTEELRHDLFKIEYLLATLRGNSTRPDADIYELVWLRERQRVLRSILAARRKLQNDKIVDLAAWRRAGLMKDDKLAEVA